MACYQASLSYQDTLLLRLLSLYEQNHNTPQRQGQEVDGTKTLPVASALQLVPACFGATARERYTLLTSTSADATAAAKGGGFDGGFDWVYQTTED
jgi:hypothetical protein